MYSKKKNYNLIIAELLSRRIPHDHETWDDQINSVIEIAKKKRCQAILDVFVNWLKQNLTKEDLDKEITPPVHPSHHTCPVSRTLKGLICRKSQKKA